MKKSIPVVLAAALFLVACSKERLNIEGEKVSVLEEKKTVAADYSVGDINISLPAVYENKSWPQAGGTASHSIGNLHSGNFEKVWSKSFGKGNSKRDFLIASPIIAEQKVFTIDAEAMLSAFNLSDGSLLWKKRLKPQINNNKNSVMKGGGVAYADGKIFAVTGFGGVFAVDAQSGKTLWKYFTKTPIRIAPTVGGRKVFVQTIDNSVFAIDTNDGSEVWRYASTASDTALVGGATSAYSQELDLLIVGFNSGEIRALKASTGSPFWSDYLVSSRLNASMSDINAIKASPVVAQEVVYAAGNNDTLTALDIRSGMRIWERQIGSSSQPVFAGKVLFWLTNSANLIAIETDSGKIVWETNLKDMDAAKENTTFAGPLLTNDKLLMVSSSGKGYFLSPQTGEKLTDFDISNGSEISPIAANGHIIITTTDAEIIAYK